MGRSPGQRHGGVVGFSYVKPEIDTTPAGFVHRCLSGGACNLGTAVSLARAEGLTDLTRPSVSSAFFPRT
jgi:hypothetical protein